MGGGTKLAIGILVMWLAMVFFFFAFHPGGVNLQQDNPAGMLQWLMSEFGNLTGTGGQTSATVSAATGTTQAPGTTTAGGRG